MTEEALKAHNQSAKQPIVVWVIFIATIISFMGLGLVDPILPAIAEKLHATPSQVSLLFSSYNLITGVAMLITGVVSSRIGVKWTLLSGIFLIVIFSALAGSSNGIWGVVSFRGGWGLGNSLFIATALSAIVGLSVGGTAKAIILYEAAIGLGISVGPLLGGELGSISWRGPFYGVSVLMIIAFLALLLKMPKVAKPKTKSSVLDPLKALKFPGLFRLGLTAFLYNIGFFTLMAFAPFVMGLHEHGLGFVFLGWGLCLAFTSVFVAPKIQAKFGTIKSMCAMLTLFALTLTAMGIWTDSSTVVIVCVIIAGLFLGTNNTLITTAVMEVAPVERATASAAYSFVRFIGGAIGPWLANKLAETFNPHIPFYSGAIFVLIAMLVVAFGRKHLAHVDRVAH
ncbi:MFS transporter [Heyndrickxia sp. FSL W8-0423]|uniref:MFS transporter n=1 Tax=Heyndrickxia sp. FSL W8-0423 TaxID=2921601 RepID=UPI0030F82652